MKTLFLIFLALTSTSGFAYNIDLNCDFYHDGDGRGTGTGETIEFRQVVKLGGVAMNTVNSPRNRRDNRLSNMDKDIIADFKDAQFRIRELTNYTKNRYRFFLDIYKKDSKGELTLISTTWLAMPQLIDGAVEAN